MFKTILGMLDSARQALTPTLSSLRQSLAGLDRIEDGLAERTFQFIATGTGPGILLELARHKARTDLLLGQPGRLYWQFGMNFNNDPDRATGPESIKARDAFYARADSTADIGLLVRLGKVLEAAGQHLDHTGASMPDWLQFLLNDATWASFGDRETAKQDGNTRAGWHIELVLALLAHEELHAAMALPILFERRGVDSYYIDKVFKRLLAPSPLDDYLLAHPEALEEASRVLSAPGRVALAARLGSNAALLARFAPLVVRLAVSDSKTVRAAAAPHLDRVERNCCITELTLLLTTGKTEERCNAADLLARLMGADAMAVLDDALANEASKPVNDAILRARSRLNAAADAGTLELPEAPPLPPLVETTVADDALAVLTANHAQLLEQLRISAEEEAAHNKEHKVDWTWRLDHYERQRQVSEKQLRAALQALNGEGGKAARDALASSGVQEVLGMGGRLESRADFGLRQVLRWAAAGVRNHQQIWHSSLFQNWLRKQDPALVDLRQLSALAQEYGAEDDCFARACLREHWGGMGLPQHVLPAERVWPLFAAMPALVDEALGLAPRSASDYWSTLDQGAAIEVLGTFPTIPARWLPRLMELALGEGKTHRSEAQDVLSKLPDIGKRVIEALGSGKQELRIEAARWLARIAYRDAIPALYAALEKETRETVSATLMTSLERLGEDLSPYLAPERLLAQARKGLKAKAPAGLAWFKLDALPACRWHDGSAVEPDIIRWWVILACKLKEPGGNALLERYLGLLDASSRAALGTLLVHQFIARDTAGPSLEEATAHASAHAPQRYQQYQQSFKQYPQYYEVQGKMSQEQVFEELRREKLGQYLGTAINEKGILALASGMPGHDMVGALQLYMRDHYQRRAQVEALLEAACASNEPAVIQFALGIARRYRTAAVQEKARVLVERIAERNGWTAEQLADRTIPTGGLDERGRLELQYGNRTLHVVLDAALKPVLQTADGKTIAALPAPRQDDPPDAIKEAKQQLSTCKKEIKQVLALQASRLYESMCAERTWPAADWREYLQQHPVVGRLVQQLVWVETVDGAAARTFRPTEDGSLIDTADDEVVLREGAAIRLAHGCHLTPQETAAWQAHFKDYKLKALFPQLARALPPALPAGADAIDDRKGWTSDTFTLRGAFNKLGYQRAQAEDGGVFFIYSKQFTSAALAVDIEFSGSSLPEENMPAALKTLSFRRLGGARYGQAALLLDQVPAVLLAEAYGDYHAVAAACAGFDPEWEKKMPW